MISIILYQPEHPGNLGAVARAMDNFGFTQLYLLNPKCDPKAEEAVYRAKHAKKILTNAKLITVNQLSTFHTIIATTAKTGTDYNIPRSPITPEQLIKVLPKNVFKSKKQIGILFGPEGAGLSNAIINKADFTVTIPTKPRNRALNLSHAVTILLYELAKNKIQKTITTQFIFASKTEKNQILKMLSQILNKITFTTKEKKQTQKIVWKRIFAKAFLTKREAYAVMGFLRKFLEK